MPAQGIEELRDFHHFLSEKLSARSDCSPEEALASRRRGHGLWRRLSEASRPPHCGPAPARAGANLAPERHGIPSSYPY